jgi:hypothetical protein
MPPVETCMCRTCKRAEAEDGQVRCRPCHRRYRNWLTGGDFYQPLWDGVVRAPEDADDPRSLLDRALAQKAEA